MLLRWTEMSLVDSERPRNYIFFLNQHGVSQYRWKGTFSLTVSLNLPPVQQHKLGQVFWTYSNLWFIAVNPWYPVNFLALKIHPHSVCPRSLVNFMLWVYFDNLTRLLWHTVGFVCLDSEQFTGNASSLGLSSHPGNKMAIN